jgi:hypothetical protein
MTEHAVLPLPPAIQGQLGLRLPKNHPILTVDGVLSEAGEFMDIRREHVRQLWESQTLVGFNIARDRATHVELRLLRKSVDLFRATNGKKRYEPEWAQVFRLVVPHQKPFVTGKEIARVLICDRGHVENLILDRQLTALKKAQCGPGGSWVISRESFENFLKGRMS